MIKHLIALGIIITLYIPTLEGTPTQEYHYCPFTYGNVKSVIETGTGSILFETEEGETLRYSGIYTIDRQASVD